MSKQQHFAIGLNDNVSSSANEIAERLLNGERLEGSFNICVPIDPQTYLLARDPLGSKKIFYGWDPLKQQLLLSDNFLDLCPLIRFRDIHSVSRGGYSKLSVNKNTKKLKKEIIPATKPSVAFDIGVIERRLRAFLLGVSAQSFDKALVCLSGGLDSTVIARFARDCFKDVEALTAVFVDEEEGFMTENLACLDLQKHHDLKNAKDIADALNIVHHVVPISLSKLDEDLPEIMKSSQDWRDYNVHCATLNYYLAKFIAKTFCGEKIAVVTGDFMNEFFADYTSEIFNGVEYYKQPKVPKDVLRRFFSRALDSSDREVGVFKNFGLNCIQPFAAVGDLYKCLDSECIQAENAKIKINGALVPKNVLNFVGQKKVRAQVGDNAGGILGWYVNNGIGQECLIDKFCEFPGMNREELNKFILAGEYRTG